MTTNQRWQLQQRQPKGFWLVFFLEVFKVSLLTLIVTDAGEGQLMTQQRGGRRHPAPADRQAKGEGKK